MFCGSNVGARREYAHAARLLSRTLANRGLGLVYGGSGIGTMGILAQAMLDAGGEVIGVIPRLLVDREVAFSGLTEERARELGYDVVTSVHRFAGNGRALIIGEPDGLVKIVADRDGAMLGVHIAGPWATELLIEGYLAVNWEATAEEVGSFIHPHPTLSELFGESALALTGRSLHA